MYQTLVGWIMMENLRHLVFGKIKVIKEPPDIRNWFSSYAYESPAPGEDESQHREGVIINQEGSEDGEMISECIDIDQGNIDGEFTLDALLHCDNFPINHNQSHLPHSDIRNPKTMRSLEGHNIQNSDEKFPAELLTPSEDSHSFEKSKAAASDENNTKLITVSGTGNTVSDHEAKNAAVSSSESGFLTTRKNRITRLHYDENHYPGSRNVAPKCFKSERRKSCSSTSYGNAAKKGAV
ncbi:unnamed protein product [Linum tenue]|uniref:Uncharacterized protein n=1 Tax=Linum tenue TaxID=586396 RepID=A0AAV0Q209_9ROSI|nr:unnamed protein product [Linum tenue]